jgi:IS1 transposase
MFIPDGDRIISKTYMTRVEGENTRLRHDLARLHRQTLCYSKCEEMLKHSIKLLIHGVAELGYDTSKNTGGESKMISRILMGIGTSPNFR